MAGEDVNSEEKLANPPSIEKKPSWASEVEDDEEASGWNAEQDAPVAGSVSLPPPTKRKNKKKKKKNNNAASQVEEVLQNLNISKTPSQSAYMAAQNDEGWQVSVSRKPRHVPLTQSLHPSNLHFSPTSSQVLSSRPSPGLLPPPLIMYENSVPYSGHIEGYHGAGNPGIDNGHGVGAGYNTTGLVSGHGSGAGFEAQHAGVQQFKFPDVGHQRSRTDHDGFRYAPSQAFQVNGSDRSHSSQHKDLVQPQPARMGGSAQPNVWGLPVRNSSAGKEDLGSGHHQGAENILSKLLPSERGREILRPSVCSTSSSTQPMSSMPSSKASYPPPDLDEIPAMAASDSACSDDDLEDDSDCFGSDSCDSEASVKSLETRKRYKWFRCFFDTLDDITNEQLMDHQRQWHCPACHGGVGAIDWYRGLQPLLAHAKTHRTKRIRLHRRFAKVLDEELERRRAGTSSLGETRFGRWKGLRNDDETKNLMIVWPPMIVIQNTQLELDEQDRWIGMGNKELLDMFKEYDPLKARHAYGPKGHRGMSIVIFAESPTGYYNAERLAKAFMEDRKGREQWELPSKLIFHPGGDRILYGYIAVAEDMEIFNRHCQEKTKLKWTLRSYNEAVAQQMRQMDEENQKLHYYKYQVQKQKARSRTLEKSMSIFTKKLEHREQEINILRERAITQHEENQREITDLENNYRDRINRLQNNTAKRERAIQEKQEELKQVHLERCQLLEKELGEAEQQTKQAKMKEEIAEQTKIVEASLRECEEYEYKKRELLRNQHVRKVEYMRKQHEESIKFEQLLEEERQELLNKYSNNVGGTKPLTCNDKNQESSTEP